MGVIKTLAVHHSDTSFGNAIMFHDYHTKPVSKGGRGWRMIGYHWVILNGLIRADQKSIFPFQNGAIETGRPVNDDLLMDEDEIGAHAYGHNKDTLGVCLVGKDRFTREQLMSLHQQIDDLIHLGMDLNVKGHHELSPPGHTVCPKIDMDILRTFLHLPFSKAFSYLFSDEMKPHILLVS